MLRNTKIVGILNITPDSFSDGGLYNSVNEAVNRVNKLIESGVDIIDIGAESTRPNQKDIITPAEEWNRLKNIIPEIIPIIKQHNILVSIDSRNSQTIKRLLIKYDIDWINDVSGMQDPEMLELIKCSNTKIVLMHNLGIPANPKVTINKKIDEVQELNNWFLRKITLLNDNDISNERIIIDPGIGFGKDAYQSIAILKKIDKFKKLNCKILLGHSRKSFFNLFTELPYNKRDLETYIISSYLLTKDIDYIRVHDVEGNIRALKIANEFFN